jgi:hypothetical protein
MADVEGEGRVGLTLSQMAKALAQVVAPTSLLTALLYYFGWAHVYYFFNYFGVNSTVLGFGTVDYLMRSVDALFVPIAVAATLALLVLWLHPAVSSRLRRGRGSWLPWHRGTIGTIGGLALAVVGAYVTFTGRVLPSQYAAWAPLSFGLGVFLLACMSHGRSRSRSRGGDAQGPAASWAGPLEWVIAFALVGVSLFAAATDYAAQVGQSRARHYASLLSTQPNVVVYSERSLSLSAPGVSQVRCREPRTAYGYRYDGLTLMLAAGGKYLLLPRRWSPAQGVAVLVDQSDSLRLEFRPSSGVGQPEVC